MMGLKLQVASFKLRELRWRAFVARALSWMLLFPRWRAFATRALLRLFANASQTRPSRGIAGSTVSVPTRLRRGGVSPFQMGGRGGQFTTLAMTLLFILITPATFAQNANVKAVLDSQKILIGDQMNLDLTVEMETGSTVDWPVLKDTITGQLEIVQASVPDTMLKETGETVIHQRMVITSFDTGYMVLPPIRFLFNDDTLQVLSTEPQLIFVGDIPVQMEAEIMDIKEPYDVPYNWRKWIKWGLLAWLILGLIAIAVYIWEKHRKKPVESAMRPKPKRPAHEIALEKLEGLRLKKLWQNDRTKEFYIELSDIIREYIEFRFDILALEMTTDETVHALRRDGMEEEKVSPLRKMLVMADLAKFAKYRPVANENERCFDIARSFISNTLVMPLDEPETKEEQP